MKRLPKSFKMKQAGALLLGTALMALAMTPAIASTRQSEPSLVISNDPLPPDLASKIYNQPSRAPVITPQQVLNDSYYDDKGETNVGHKVDELRSQLATLQGKVSNLASSLASIENTSQTQAASYYASIATINTQLQSGTTPGNPRLIAKLGVARQNLEVLGSNITTLNDLAVAINGASSNASYLLEAIRATYSLSGAVEEDHVHLQQEEDAVNDTSVIIDRLLNKVNDDITRTNTYMTAERENLRTLTLAISSGNMFGKSLAARPFSSGALPAFSPDSSSPVATASNPTAAPAPGQPAAYTGGARPLVKIRFDHPNVNYEQPMYAAVNAALSRYPDARFELVAVHPGKGNAAEVAIQSTQARRNAEKVLRSLTEMGLDLDRVDLSYMPSNEASTNEVDLYIR